MKKQRAIEIIKKLLNDAKDAEMYRGYYNCSDYDYYAQSLTDKELKELGMPIPEREE